MVELTIPVSTDVAADSVLAVAARAAGQRVEFGQHYCKHCVHLNFICTEPGGCLSSPCSSRPRRDVIAFIQSDLAFPCRLPYTTASRKLAHVCIAVRKHRHCHNERVHKEPNDNHHRYRLHWMILEATTNIIHAARRVDLAGFDLVL